MHLLLMVKSKFIFVNFCHFFLNREGLKKLMDDFWKKVIRLRFVECRIIFIIKGPSDAFSSPRNRINQLKSDHQLCFIERAHAHAIKNNAYVN